ncbi:DUF6838 family protein [Bacillus manliponensis]|uniref:phage tail terminator family protein n=1 Tax=Bacillus manliponensis TaxID=574376 RepID=UPI00351338D1
MITYKDIKLAVNRLIKSRFNIEINSNDVEEGFKRPSFFVQLEDNERSGYETQVHKSLTIRIYYFPKDRNKNSIELLDVQEQLENLFDLKLEVKDRYFNIDSVQNNTPDGVLDFSFDIAFYEGREIDDTTNPIETMGELDFERK